MKKGGAAMCHVWVADQSGSVTLSIWDDNIDGVQVGDVLRLTNG